MELAPSPISLSKLLKWTDGENLVHAVKNQKEKHLAFTAKCLVGCFSDLPNSTGEHLLQSLQKLGNDELVALLGNPETFRQISLVFNNRKAHFTEYFSGIFDPKNNTSKNINPPIDFAVDFNSALAKIDIQSSNFRSSFDTYSRYSLDERSSVAAKIGAAVDKMKLLAAGPYDFMDQMIEIVVPRKDEKNPTFKGSSNRGIIGRVNLINPHLNGVVDTVVASSLLHEAIHTFLYISEYQKPIFKDLDAAHTNFIESPWSGNQVHVLALVHATFVWYGIMNYFSLPGASEIFKGKERTYYLNFCTAGFSKGSILSLLGKHREIVSEDILSELSKIDDYFSKHYDFESEKH